METRPVDTNELLGALRSIVEEGKEVRLTVTGSSMNPFLIHMRDSVILGPVDRPLRRGDIVMYVRPEGRNVLHRIRRISNEGLYIIGDGQTETEGPLDKSCVWAIVKKVCRKGKWIAPGDTWWTFFSTVWLWVIPARRKIMGLARKIGI